MTTLVLFSLLSTGILGGKESTRFENCVAILSDEPPMPGSAGSIAEGPSRARPAHGPLVGTGILVGRNVVLTSGDVLRKEIKRIYLGTNVSDGNIGKGTFIKIKERIAHPEYRQSPKGYWVDVEHDVAILILERDV